MPIIIRFFFLQEKRRVKVKLVKLWSPAWQSSLAGALVWISGVQQGATFGPAIALFPDLGGVESCLQSPTNKNSLTRNHSIKLQEHHIINLHNLLFCCTTMGIQLLPSNAFFLRKDCQKLFISWAVGVANLPCYWCNNPMTQKYHPTTEEHIFHTRIAIGICTWMGK